MRYLAAIFALLATPALAHHEVVVATSVLPLAAAFAVVAVGVAAFIRKLHRAPQGRQRARKDHSMSR